MSGSINPLFGDIPGAPSYAAPGAGGTGGLSDLADAIKYINGTGAALGAGQTVPTMIVRPDGAAGSTPLSQSGTDASSMGTAASAPSSWLGSIGSWLGGFASRGALIVLAILLILGAMYLFAAREGVVPGVSGKPA